MDIHLNRSAGIPIHEQVSAQLVFLIGTGGLKPGTLLPSVRALAHRLGVHRNTIHRAYRDMTLNRLVEKRPGRRLAVAGSEAGTERVAEDLDDLLEIAVREASRRGYSVQQLHDRLQQRLAAGPPTRLLVLSDDPGMRLLLPTELGERFSCPVEACAPGDLRANANRTVGALVISPPGHIPAIRTVLPRERPPIAITYSSGDWHLEAIRQLTTPSMIAIVSVSRYFLEMGQRLLAAAVGRRHSMRGYLMTRKSLTWPRAADILVCDSITYPIVCSRSSGRVLVYRVIADACIDRISEAMGQATFRTGAGK